MNPDVSRQVRARYRIGNPAESDPGDQKGKTIARAEVDGNGTGNGNGNGNGKKRGREGGSNPYILNLILARTLRFLGQIGFLWHTYLLRPRGHWPSTTRSVRMRDGGVIDLYIYLPEGSHSGPPSGQSVGPGAKEGAGTGAGHRAEVVDGNKNEDGKEGERKTCVINFHGGGWSIGSPTDDSRWALFCTSTPLHSIFISVNYRLAPEHPYPTPVLDCIDATRWIIEHADELGVDKDRVVLSGFSAGGCLAVATAIGLANPELERGVEVVKYVHPSSSSARLPNTKSTPNSDSTDPRLNPLSSPNPDAHQPQVPRIRLKGLIPFYPLVDFSTPRKLKLSRSPDPKSMKPLPGWLTKMFDSGYLPPQIDRRHPFISPLFASHELLKELPSVHFVLCGADVLAQEGQDMADRLRGVYTADSHSETELVTEGNAGDTPHTSAHEMSKSLEHSTEREVIARWVTGARHGWDKPPHLVRQSVIDEYTAAVDSIKRWCSQPTSSVSG